jgi:hypothetical protein
LCESASKVRVGKSTPEQHPVNLVQADALLDVRV